MKVSNFSRNKTTAGCLRTFLAGALVLSCGFSASVHAEGGLGAVLSKKIPLSRPDITDPPPRASTEGIQLDGPMNPKRTQTAEDLAPFLWNRDLAILRHERYPENTFDEVLTAVIKLTEQACLSRAISTLDYNTTERSPECIRALTDLEAISSSIPAFICARDGLNSQTCSKAHQSMEVETRSKTNPPELPKEARDFFGDEEDLERRLAEPLKELQKLGSPRYLEELPEDERKEKQHLLQKTLNRLLAIACSDSSYSTKDKVIEEPAQEHDPLSFMRRENIAKNLAPEGSSFSTSYSTQKPEANIPKNPLSATSPRPKANQQREPLKLPEGKTIVRIITPVCQKMIDSAFRWDANFTEAICAQYGDFSPNCVQARHRESAELAKQRNTSANLKSAVNPTKPKEREQLFKTF